MRSTAAQLHQRVNPRQIPLPPAYTIARNDKAMWATRATRVRQNLHDSARLPCYAAAVSQNLQTIDELHAILNPQQRLLGLDLGTKTIGVAVSDPGRRIATPSQTVRRTKFRADAEQLIALAGKYAAAAFVIGMPFNMDGSEGPRAQATRAFVRNMAALDQRPFVLWDERLSTAAVTRELIAQDTSRARRAEVVDEHAAAYILQGALDRLNALSG